MTFDVFGDFGSRGYLRNTAGLKDPRAVKEFEHRAYVRNVATAVEHLKNIKHITYQDILDTHKILFQEVYPVGGARPSHHGTEHRHIKGRPRRSFCPP